MGVTKLPMKKKNSSKAVGLMEGTETQKNQKLGDLAVYGLVKIPSCLVESRTANPLWLQSTINAVHPEKRWAGSK